jgi:hypothetical protein
MDKAEAAGGLEKNGLPRVAWTFEAWKEPPKSRHFRLVLTEASAYDDRHLLSWSEGAGGGVRVVLEVLEGQDSMGQARWREVSEADASELPPVVLDAVWGLARQVLEFDGPHCMACGDTGAAPNGREPKPDDTCARNGCGKLRRFHGPRGEAGSCRFLEREEEAQSAPCAKCERGAQVAEHRRALDARRDAPGGDRFDGSDASWEKAREKARAEQETAA